MRYGFFIAAFICFVLAALPVLDGRLVPIGLALWLAGEHLPL